MNELILIVEDEQDVAELVRYNLEKQGYRTIVAENGEQAITAVQCHETDLALLDIMLPELNGWEVCRTLRASSKGKSLPVIMLTALASEDDRVKGLSLGADDYLTKPFSVKELLLKVDRIIDKERALKTLRQKNGEQDASFRYLVHEIKNSVSVIGGFSHLAIAKGKADAYMGHITSTALHMENILNDASLIARLERGNGSLALEPVDIDSSVEDVAELFQELARRDGISIVILNATAEAVMANVTAVKQILINLLGNAIKYNRNGGVVRIAFNDRERFVDVSVSDEGIGIQKEELPKVFEKFYRAKGSERVKGSGLGLYVVKLLTLATGGTVIAESAAGKGSTFTVSFKKTDAPHQPPQEAAEERKEEVCRHS